MKKQIGFIIGAIILAWAIMSRPPVEVKAQRFVTNYLWADSIQGLGTTSVDSIYDTPWQQVVFKADTGAVFIRIGAPDTANWSSRDFYKIGAGESLSFGPATKVKRAEFKSFAGTVDFYTIGYKTVTQ